MTVNKLTAHWQRRLEIGDRPAYLLIAELIAEDVRTGRLVARERLPTLRELADQLGLNYTTVARAYAEARKRGLIDSRPGMGTYVRNSRGRVTVNMPWRNVDFWRRMLGPELEHFSFRDASDRRSDGLAYTWPPPATVGETSGPAANGRVAA